MEAETVIFPGVVMPNCSHSEKFEIVAAALVEASAKIGVASKDSTNPHFHSKYADLTSIMDVAKPALTEAGIVILQPPFMADSGYVTVATILLHKSGQWIACELGMSPVDNRPQSVGSAITYARRYGLSGLLGLTAEDDDGNAASGRQAQQKVAERKIAEGAKPKAESAQPSTPGEIPEELKGILARLPEKGGTETGIKMLKSFMSEELGPALADARFAELCKTHNIQPKGNGISSIKALLLDMFAIGEAAKKAKAEAASINQEPVNA